MAKIKMRFWKLFYSKEYNKQDYIRSFAMSTNRETEHTTTMYIMFDK